MGFEVGVVSNAYWATSQDDALACLRPFAGLLHDMTISSDLFHYSEKLSRQATHATAATTTNWAFPSARLASPGPTVPGGRSG